ncbi:MAG: Gfo/Idh/MocA family oxidoreductase, partial [Candidatus Sumerlaeota bacterium]
MAKKAQKNKPIRVGLVGIGRAGWKMHCRGMEKYADMFEIVAACDILPDRVEKMEERYGCKAYTDYKEMLKDP